MLKQNFERSLGFLMHDVSRLLRTEYNRRVRDLGLTRSQWRVLAHLHRSEGVTQTELADILEIEQATLARHLDRLEGAGWLERRPCEKDRRANRLFLTDKPRSIVDQMFAVSTTLQEEIMDGLEETARRQLLDDLQLIKLNLLEITAASANGESPETDQAPRRAARGG
ncbi:MAG: MarR family transcriptional regulator [Rhodospirillaceae bacterium]|jgi:MarR family transcriptional regulator, transcriptional regulator for hemolysin|nr:MarR family transcriptional regulator [Rhodospirillaceae bacterium]MBT6116343.1 MarR family transcriptional regulator [Rhodospirillaceae bacterium]